MKKLLLLSLIVMVFGCEGKRGPMGLTGAQGESGPGSRIIYESTVPIPTDFYMVDIPEITIDDMPLASVYIALEEDHLWFELPTYFEDLPDFGLICFFTEGIVTFVRCDGFLYKIVIVI